MADTAAPRKDNAFTRKIGPLPMWAWLAIVGGVILLWAWYEHRKSAAATSASSDTSSTQPPEVIQTTPPTINITTPPGTKPPDHHGRHGNRMVSVPNVIGEEYEAGAPKIAAAGLTPQRSSPFVGKVTRESPSAGSKVARGSVVTLSGRPWPQTQKGAPTPAEKQPDGTTPKVNPGGTDKTVHKKRRKLKVSM